MNVSVTPELAQFVQGLVSSGRYHSISEVFRDGLRLLEQAERHRLLEAWLLDHSGGANAPRIPRNAAVRMRAHVQTKIQEGLDALARGDAVDGAQFLSGWRTRHLKKTTAAASTIQSRARRRSRK